VLEWGFNMFHKNFLIFWKKYKFKSIVIKNSIRLFLIFLIILILPVSFLYGIVSNNATKQVEMENVASTKKMGEIIETLFRDTEYLASEILFDSDVADFMTLGKKMPYSEEKKSNLAEKVKSYASGKTIIYSVSLYNENKNMLCDESVCDEISEFEDLSWLDIYNVDFYKVYNASVRTVHNTSNRVVTFIKKYINNKGAVIVNIDLMKLERYVKAEFDKGSGFYIINGKDIIYTNLFSKQRNAQLEKYLIKRINSKQGDGAIVSEDGKTLIALEKSSYYDWYYVRVLDGVEYKKVKLQIIYIWILIFIVLLFFIIFVSTILSLNDVSQVVNILDLFENRDIYKNLTKNEISDIANKIIFLMDDNEKLKKEISTRNNQYWQWEIKALQAQITPHFLNNTLAVINLEIFNEFNGPTRASDMLAELSRVLGYTLVTDKIFVKLDDELRFIKIYSDILKLRYQNFDLEIDVNENLREKKIIRMCLQPLIENSVFHAFKEEGGKIHIKCQEIDNSIVISVEDNGDGMSDAEINKLKNSFKNNEMNDESIGLKNVYKRLKAVYGDEVSMDIQSEQGLYTRIIIKIPQKES